MSIRNWKRKIGRLTIQTWPYSEGRAQTTYLWLPNWTIHIAVIRKHNR